MQPVNQRRTQALGHSASAPKKKSAGKWLFFLILLGVLAGVAMELYKFLPIHLVREAPVLTGLHPIVEKQAAVLVEQSAAIGIPIKITDGFRSSIEQDALYAQGRTHAGAVVTKAKGGKSYHNYGLAIDFALLTAAGGVIWDLEMDRNGNGKSDWLEVAAIGKQLGFTWGGDWESFPDYPHLQMNFGYSLQSLQLGWRPSASGK